MLSELQMMLIVVVVVFSVTGLAYWYMRPSLLQDPTETIRYPRSVLKIRMREKNLAGEIKNLLGLPEWEWQVTSEHLRATSGRQVKIERKARPGVYIVYLVNLSEKKVYVYRIGRSVVKEFPADDKHVVISEIRQLLSELR